MQSIAKQYHILPSEQEELHYPDWYRLVAGLMEDTPLGRIVQIRAETDREAIERMGEYEHGVRRRWREFRANKVKAEVKPEQYAAMFEKMFENMFGGGV